MEYAKDEIFKIKYNSSLNRLQIKKEKWTSKLAHSIKKHKLLTTIVLLFITFSFINVFLIYYFMTLLQNTKIL